MKMVKQVVLLVIVLLASTLDNVFGQSDALTDCSTMEFSTVAKTCCVKPYGKLFVMANLTAASKTCKASSRLMSWANDYKINGLQRMGLANFIDTANEATKTALCIYGSFMECVFEKNSWLDASGTVDVAALFDHVNEKAPDSYWKRIAKEMLDPLNTANTASYNFTDMVVDRFENIQCASKLVNLKPLMMAQMIQSEHIWMCPEQANYTAANMCNETMNNYQFCDGKIYNQDAKGVFFFPHV